MTKISGVIITFNEEKSIENCLKSLVGVVDEIVVIDSFSTDRTKEICKAYNVGVIQQKFLGFTDQKNFAMSKAKYDYVLSLDADEALSKQLSDEILKAKNNLEFDGYSFNRLNNYCGTWIKHSGWYPDNKIRLFNRKKAHWVGENNLHEIVILDDPKKHKHLKGDLLHWSYNSYGEHCVKINKYTDIAATAIANRKKKSSVFVIKAIVNPFWKFIKNYFIKLGFLDGFQGFVICIFTAYETFLKYAKVIQLQQRKINK